MWRSRRTRNKTKMRSGKNTRKIRMRGGKNVRKTRMRGGKNARKTRMHRRKYVMRGGGDNSAGSPAVYGGKKGDYAYVESDVPGHKVKVYDVNDPDTQIHDREFGEAMGKEKRRREANLALSRSRGRDSAVALAYEEAYIKKMYDGNENIELDDGWIVQKYTIDEFNKIQGLRKIPEFAKRRYRGKTIVLWYDTEHRFYNKYGCIETKYLKDLGHDYANHIGFICDDTWYCGRDLAIQRAPALEPEQGLSHTTSVASSIADDSPEQGLSHTTSVASSIADDAFFDVDDFEDPELEPEDDIFDGGVDDLPSDWSFDYTDSGEVYYVNDLTEETQWEKPTEAAKPLPPGWEVIRNESGEIRYKKSGSTRSPQSWRPTGLPYQGKRK